MKYARLTFVAAFLTDHSSETTHSTVGWAEHPVPAVMSQPHSSSLPCERSAAFILLTFSVSVSIFRSSILYPTVHFSTISVINSYMWRQPAIPVPKLRKDIWVLRRTPAYCIVMAVKHIRTVLTPDRAACATTAWLTAFCSLCQNSVTLQKLATQIYCHNANLSEIASEGPKNIQGNILETKDISCYWMKNIW